MEVAGVNGCDGGWVVARTLVSQRLSPPDVWVVPHFEDVIVSTSRCAAVAVDIPVGLTEGAAREPDPPTDSRGLLMRIVY